MVKVHQDGKGYFRFGKGFDLKDGKRVQRHHSLGKDKKSAQILANYIEAEWTSLDGDETQKVWTAEALKRAKDNASKSAPDLTTPPPAPKAKTAGPTPFFQPTEPPAPIPSGVTLFHAFEMYKTELDTFVQGKQMDASTAREFMSRVNSAKAHFDDLSLSQVDNEYLRKIRLSITARPLKKLPERKVKMDKDGKVIPRPVRIAEPIAVDTVTNWLMALSMAFDFFVRKNAPTKENPRQKLWTPDEPTWREAFKISKADKRQLRTANEKNAAKKPKQTYEIEQLKYIYQRTVPLIRLHILCGVCLGWSQKGAECLP